MRRAWKFISCVVLEISVTIEKIGQLQNLVARGLLTYKTSSDINLEHSQASTARTLDY
jgi:hypothetical protein